MAKGVTWKRFLGQLACKIALMSDPRSIGFFENGLCEDVLSGRNMTSPRRRR